MYTFHAIFQKSGENSEEYRGPKISVRIINLYYITDFNSLPTKYEGNFKDVS